MAKARTLDKRRKSIRNIRKITRTMELISTARYRQAMMRATAATAYTERIGRMVAELMRSGTPLKHPLLEPREETGSALLLILTANRGMCAGYNNNVLRSAAARRSELQAQTAHLQLEVSGKKGISMLKFRKIPVDQAYTHFEDKPSFEEVDTLATRYLDAYASGKLDRLDIAYTKLISSTQQDAVVETLLPLGLEADQEAADTKTDEELEPVEYEFLPSPEDILAEVVPTSFKVKVFKCFLDAAVSEQIARMRAMKAATENADEMIRHLSMTYNRARQSQITSEITEIIGGVEALKH
jgi:F-type H+-transporting ATPase subunit gamma